MYFRIENFQVLLNKFQTIKFEKVFKNPAILKRSDLLLKIRIGFYILAFTHLMFISNMLISVDFTKEEDPKLRNYQFVRWRLITAWFNLISLAYLPVCAYCDWRELRSEGEMRHVELLNIIRHVLFTSILLPTTLFADIIFWRLWTKDRELIAPVSVDRLIPYWTQHCMHTVSLFVVILDLILVPRMRPKSLWPGIALMFAFFFSYACMLGISFMEGEFIYPVLKNLSSMKLIVIFPLYALCEFLFYYTAQWFVIDIIWTRKSKKAN